MRHKSDYYNVHVESLFTLRRNDSQESYSTPSSDRGIDSSEVKIV